MTAALRVAVTTLSHEPWTNEPATYGSPCSERERFRADVSGEWQLAARTVGAGEVTF